MDVWRNVAVDNDGDADNQVTADGPVTLKRIVASNDNATDDAYVHVYRDEHANVTPGTTTPDMTVLVPAGSTIDAEIFLPSNDGLTICASNAAAGSGTAVTAVLVNAFFG